jgi:hypothetical protein
MRKVTCKEHYCEYHKSYGCPCTCKVCSERLEQATEDNKILQAMQEEFGYDWLTEVEGESP